MHSYGAIKTGKVKKSLKGRESGISATNSASVEAVVLIVYGFRKDC